MTKPESAPKPPEDPLDTMARASAAVLVSEVLAMIAVSWSGIADGPTAWLLDATLLAGLATPLVYVAVSHRLQAQNRVRASLEIAATLFIVEFVVMSSLSRLSLELLPTVRNLLDASVVIFVCLPLLWLVLLRRVERQDMQRISGTGH